MAGYIGSKAVNLSTTGADINGDANIDGTVTADGLTVDGTADVDNLVIDNAGKISSSGQIELQVDTDNNQSGTYIGFSRNNTTSERLALFSENGDISFYEDTGSTPKFFWDASAESLGIGTSSPARTLEVYSSAPAIKLNNGTNAFTIGTGAFVDGSNSLVFFDEGVGERMRIDSGGNLLVGKTSNSSAFAGAMLYDTGNVFGTVDGNYCARFNRLTSDGNIAEFQKDGSTVGSIGTSGGATYLSGPSRGLMFANNQTYPVTNTGASSDDAYDLGGPSARFSDIYATNATIQTSDRNEKQDIAELSDAEQRVAVAAKGLLRKFRWRSAVTEKGDEARTHFGIIAQDLQAAFVAEGLDAGDYAMFISSTWTDEETGEERTRMGVRYSELLAFIIGAL